MQFSAFTLSSHTDVWPFVVQTFYSAFMIVCMIFGYQQSDRFMFHTYESILAQYYSDNAKLTLLNTLIIAAGKEKQSLPYLLFLQGGPGFESPRPTEASGWIKKACEDHHIVLLDQVPFIVLA